MEFNELSKSPTESQNQSPFNEQELEILTLAGSKYQTSAQREKIAQDLSSKVNLLSLDLRNKILIHMEEKLNPDDPLDRVNKELSLVPFGVSCVHNADKNVLAATINGYELQFQVPKLSLAFDQEKAAERLIEIAKQNTGDKRIHDKGPRNRTEEKALSQSLADELASLTPPQKFSLLNHMVNRYSATDNLDKMRREQKGIPLGVEASKGKDGKFSSLSINGLYLRV